MIYRLFFRLVLQRFDSERAHAMAIATMRVWAWIPGAVALTDWLLRPPRALKTNALGLEFRTPLGLAAGVDKNATAFDALSALGFGAVEVGTATNLPQQGNERPRVWRLPSDRALLNAMGFPNSGAAAQAERLAKRCTSQVLGINIGKSKAVDLGGDVVGDYRAATRKLAPHADYLALNVSSPNTPGLRSMQSVEDLRMLVDGVRAELAELKCQIPILVKLGPDLHDDEIIGLAEAASRIEIDGIIAVNTTTDYEKTSACRAAIAAHGDRGGISGQPLKRRALEVLELLSARVENLPLVSVGGIETAEDAWQRILAGATLIQAHTGFVYGGPLWPRRVNRDLAQILASSPYTSIEEAVGKGLPGAVSDAAHSSDDADDRQSLGARATSTA
jgi:dihydroorotate dehydrogenase